MFYPASLSKYIYLIIALGSALPSPTVSSHSQVPVSTLVLCCTLVDRNGQVVTGVAEIIWKVEPNPSQLEKTCAGSFKLTNISPTNSISFAAFMEMCPTLEAGDESSRNRAIMLSLPAFHGLPLRPSCSPLPMLKNFPCMKSHAVHKNILSKTFLNPNWN